MDVRQPEWCKWHHAMQFERMRRRMGLWLLLCTFTRSGLAPLFLSLSSRGSLRSRCAGLKEMRSRTLAILTANLHPFFKSARLIALQGRQGTEESNATNRRGLTITHSPSPSSHHTCALSWEFWKNWEEGALSRDRARERLSAFPRHHMPRLHSASSPLSLGRRARRVMTVAWYDRARASELTHSAYSPPERSALPSCLPPASFLSLCRGSTAATWVRGRGGGGIQ